MTRHPLRFKDMKSKFLSYLKEIRELLEMYLLKQKKILFKINADLDHIQLNFKISIGMLNGKYFLISFCYKKEFLSI